MKRLIGIMYLLFAKDYVLIARDKGGYNDLSNCDPLYKLDIAYTLSEHGEKRLNELFKTDELEQELAVITAYEILNEKLDR